MKTDIRNRERGQAMVETAIAIPLLLMMMVGIFEVGRAYETWQVLTNAAREGARMAVTPSGTAREYDGARSPVHGRRPAHKSATAPVIVNRTASINVNGTPVSASLGDRRLSVRVHHAAAGGPAGRTIVHGRRGDHHARDGDYA